MRHALALTVGTVLLASMNADGEVLVSNFFDDDATSRGNLHKDFFISDAIFAATSFEVGTEAPSYVVTEIQIELDASNDLVGTRVRIYENKSNKPGGSKDTFVYVGGSREQIANDRYRGTYRKASGAVLDSGKKYWLRLDKNSNSQGGNNAEPWVTDSDSEESADGWTIGESKIHTGNNCNYVSTCMTGDIDFDGDRPLRFAIHGEPSLHAERLSLWYYECPKDKIKHWVRFRTNKPIFIASSALRNSFGVDNGSVEGSKRIRWSHKYIDGRKRKVTKEYRIGVVPATSGDVTISLKSSEGCGGTELCAKGELGMVGDYQLTIPDANQPPTLAISANTDHPNYDKIDQGFLETGHMSFPTTLSGTSLSHYRFEVATIDEGENKGTATLDDYRSAEHRQYIRMIYDADDGLVFEDPSPTTIYLVDDAVEEDDETVVVELSNAYTVDDRYDRKCPISVTTNRATATILDDDD